MEKLGKGIAEAEQRLKALESAAKDAPKAATAIPTGTGTGTGSSTSSGGVGTCGFPLPMMWLRLGHASGDGPMLTFPKPYKVTAPAEKSKAQGSRKQKNSAFVFIKPHANTPATKKMLTKLLGDKGLTV
eukprot:SAG11_NODE_16924_length_533_cov_1.483871_1_plen_128_part_01